MTHDELRQELQDFADSTDEHIETEDAVRALGELVERIRAEGLHTPEADQ